MKNWKVLFTLLITLFLAACGESKDEGGRVKLSYMIWDKYQQPGMQEMIDRFEELNPDIEVEIQMYPWAQYWTKLDALAEGGNLPDLFWMHIGYFSRYSEAEVMLDITDRVTEEIDLSKFERVVTDIYRSNGRYYGLPKDIDTVGLWYNKKLFDEAGVPYPTEAMTWDEFVEVSKKLTDRKKGTYGFAARLEGQTGHDNAILQNNGFIISEDKKSSGMDTPETMEAVQWYVDLIGKHQVSPSLSEMVEISPLEMFFNGQVAMIIDGSWMLNAMLTNEYTLENADVTYLFKGKREGTIANGLGNVISDQSKHPEEAWKFLKFLSSEEGNLIQGRSGAAIPAYKSAQDEWINSDKTFNLKVFTDQLSYGLPYPNSKTRNTWYQDEKRIFSRVWSGELGVEEGCREYAQRMNRLLATEE